MTRALGIILGSLLGLAVFGLAEVIAHSGNNPFDAAVAGEIP